MTEHATERLERARAGSEEAFRELVEPYRSELRVHVYRMLGSVQDAEDIVQETLLAAWRGLEGFRGEASLRAWLYRIATNSGMNELRRRRRRPLPPPPEPPGQPPPPSRIAPQVWLEPFPDSLLAELPDRAGATDARYDAREAIELSFVAALQRLSAGQRVALVLRDVLGFRAKEVAEIMGTSVAAANGLLRRAREALRADRPEWELERATRPSARRERELAGRFRLVPTRANGQPAFGCYLRDPSGTRLHAYGLMVLTTRRDGIAQITGFPDTSVFPHFGLPRTLRD